jgi:hypothetical protein
LTEAEALRLLEEQQSAEPGMWWEDVPVITFDATAKHSSVADIETSEIRAKPREADGANRASLLELPVVKAAMLMAALAVMLLVLALIRR